MSIPTKIHERVLIEKAYEMTEGLIGEKQCGFRMGRGCGDQVFVIKQISEKCIAKGESISDIHGS